MWNTFLKNSKFLLLLVNCEEVEPPVRMFSVCMLVNGNDCGECIARVFGAVL